MFSSNSDGHFYWSSWAPFPEWQQVSTSYNLQLIFSRHSTTHNLQRAVFQCRRTQTVQGGLRKYFKSKINCSTHGLKSLSPASFNQDYIFAFNIYLCLISCKVVSWPDPEAVLLLKYLTNEHPQLPIISSL